MSDFALPKAFQAVIVLFGGPNYVAYINMTDALPSIDPATLR
jgi:hypothetical protein